MKKKSTLKLKWEANNKPPYAIEITAWVGERCVRVGQYRGRKMFSVSQNTILSFVFNCHKLFKTAENAELYVESELKKWTITVTKALIFGVPK